MRIVKPSFEILSPQSAEEGREILLQIERTARTCYKSEGKITEGSAAKLVTSLRDRGHHAMLEFGMMAVRFVTCRGISHELVRHRLCSFGQESTRFVRYGDIEVVPPYEITHSTEDVYYGWMGAIYKAEQAYKDLLDLGMAPQIARSVLPTCLKTEIVVQANLREWRHIFELRTDKAAHPDMRRLMIPLLAEVKQRIPIVFDDIEVPVDLEGKE